MVDGATGSAGALGTATRRVLVLLTVAALPLFGALPAAAAAGSVTGVMFEDANRDGRQQTGEPGWANLGLNVYRGDQLLGYAVTDAAGRYAFGPVEAGTYTVKMDPWDWWAVRDTWVPTTTGSVFPEITVTVSGDAVADLGWRRIVRSTDVAAPLDSYVGPSGLRVNTYNDAVAARTVHDAIAAGLMGDEAPLTVVRFDYDSINATDVHVAGSAGTYTDFRAYVHSSYQSWLTQRDASLSHEYGHAWSKYYAHMAQQDATFGAYVEARGLAGDPRLHSSHAWAPDEMIAEDYRQLFGSATARQRPQENREIPPAASVPGLADFLRTTFTQPAGGTPPPDDPPPPPDPQPGPAAPAITGLSVAPNPVVTTGNVTFSVADAARVTVQIRTARGEPVRTLTTDQPVPAGSSTFAWNRTDDRGRTVKAATYTVVVSSGNDAGTDTATLSFSVVDSTSTGGSPKGRR